MGALALTGQEAKRKPFEPLLGGVNFVEYGDVAAMEEAVSDRTAAIFLEPIQGEYGVVVPPPDYLQAVRQIANTHGALLIFDEVQTGIGRTGSWFAFQQSGVRPDVMTLAKGLGGGLPIGACVAFGDAAELLQAGHHASTFGGNPVACAAALAVLQTIEDEHLLQNVKAMSERLRNGIEGLALKELETVRGEGLLLGLVFRSDIAVAVQNTALASGFIVNATSANVVRLAPPLIINPSQVDALISGLTTIVGTAVSLSS